MCDIDDEGGGVCVCVFPKGLIESVYSHVGPYYSCVSPVLHPRVKLIKRGAVGQEGESKCLVILNTGRRRGAQGLMGGEG